MTILVQHHRYLIIFVKYQEWQKTYDEHIKNKVARDARLQERAETINNRRNERIVNNIKKILNGDKTNAEIQESLQNYLKNVAAFFLKKDIDTSKLDDKLQVDEAIEDDGV